MDMWGKIEDWCKEIANALKGNDIAKQHKSVCLFLNGIQESEGDVIACCADLVESNTKLMFGDYCKDVGEGFVCIEEKQCKPTVWQMCYELFIYGYKDMLKFEKDMLKFEDGSFEWRIREHTLKNCDVEDKEMDEVIDGKRQLCFTREARGNTYGWYSSFAYYYKTHNTFAYKLCKRLCEYLCKSKNIPDISPLEKQDLTTIVKTVCLFTALKNEQARLNNEAFINNITLPKIPTGGTKLHTGEGKQQRGGETLPDEKNSDSVKENVFTSPRAKFYFELAQKRGWIAHNGDGTYKWDYGGAKTVSFVFFIVSIYKSDPPFNLWEKLFKKTGLKQSSLDMRNRDYYKKYCTHLTDEQKENYKKFPPQIPKWLPLLYNFFKDNTPKHPTK